MNEELSNILVEAMEVLTPKQREVWTLCMVKGLSLEKAARALAPSKSAVQHRLNLAIKKMKQEMERIKSERGIPNEYIHRR